MVLQTKLFTTQNFRFIYRITRVSATCYTDGLLTVALSNVGACAGRQQRLPVKLLVLHSRHYDVPAAFPRQLHLCRVQRVPYEEANVLRQRYSHKHLFVYIT